MSKEKANNNTNPMKLSSNGKKKILVGVFAMTVVAGVVYATLTKDATTQARTMGNIKTTANDVKLNQGGVVLEQDTLGLTDGNKKYEEVAQKNYESKVANAILNNETKIINRDNDKRLEFQQTENSRNTVDTAVIEEQIRVPEIAVTPLERPAMVEVKTDLDTAQENVEKQQFNNAGYDINLAKVMMRQNMRNYASEMEKFNQASKSEGVEVVSLTGSDFAQKSNAAATYKTQAYLNAQQTAYENSVKASQATTQVANNNTRTQGGTAVGSSQATSAYPTIKVGDMFDAYTELGATNKNLGPIKATLTSGAYSGATLIGTVTAGNEVLTVTFTQMYLPESDKAIAINAILYDAENSRVGAATDVDTHVFKRYFLQPALRGIAEVGRYYANNTGTTTSTATSTTTSSQASAEAARKVALGGAAEQLSSDVEAMDTSTTITLDKYTPVKVMFMQEVRIGSESSDKDTNTLDRNNLKDAPKYVESAETPELKQNSVYVYPHNSYYPVANYGYGGMGGAPAPQPNAASTTTSSQ